MGLPVARKLARWQTAPAYQIREPYTNLDTATDNYSQTGTINYGQGDKGYQEQINTF